MAVSAVTLFTFVLALAPSIQLPNIQIRGTERTLMHSYVKPGPTVAWSSSFDPVTVVIDDYPSGPKAVVIEIENGSTKKRAFAVSKTRFDKMWATFKSSGADKYLLTDSKTLEIEYSYLFLSSPSFAIMPSSRNPYYIQRDIKRAWVAAVISATVTLAISIFVVIAHRPFYGVSGWTLFDAVLMYGLAIGVYLRSRIAIVLLICYFALSKLYLYSVTGKTGALLGLAIFGYFFITGALAIFEHHRVRREA